MSERVELRAGLNWKGLLFICCLLLVRADYIGLTLGRGRAQPETRRARGIAGGGQAWAPRLSHLRDQVLALRLAQARIPKSIRASDLPVSPSHCHRS